MKISLSQSRNASSGKFKLAGISPRLKSQWLHRWDFFTYSRSINHENIRERQLQVDEIELKVFKVDLSAFDWKKSLRDLKACSTKVIWESLVYLLLTIVFRYLRKAERDYWGIWGRVGWWEQNWFNIHFSLLWWILWSASRILLNEFEHGKSTRSRELLSWMFHWKFLENASWWAARW